MWISCKVEDIAWYDTVILCDFDWTITSKDVCDEIMNRFWKDNWHKAGELYDQQQISHKELNRIFIDHLDVSPHDLELFLNENINIREGFFTFIENCRKRRCLPIIISWWWDFYIKSVLKDINLSFNESVEWIDFDSSDMINVFSNRISFNENIWDIEYVQDTDNDEVVPDKGFILSEIRSKWIKKVYVIWDSTTDFWVAENADFVFSCWKLSHFCKDNQIKHYNFNNFNEIDIFLNNI
ncbi:MAG: phosphoserine phosphatase [uncultured bacterium (gcode 4)]|uniref:Phosphoserine phosphatase n=1 Tax=uncultured bacterium (gcode 4) TaxID=1234023 RepID=K2GCX8_9BACT|nr:MAG: phosphoserine phosphatase [uncultured bacterium (gcode 4)]